MAFLIIGLIVLGVVALYFFIRWFMSPERVAIRKARRARRHLRWCKGCSNPVHNEPQP